MKDLSGFKGKELDWKSDMVHVENNGQIENVKINCHLPYQSYRKKASSFWMDIPHHEAKIRKKETKRQISNVKTSMEKYELNFESSASQRQQKEKEEEKTQCCLKP